MKRREFLAHIRKPSYFAAFLVSFFTLALILMVSYLYWKINSLEGKQALILSQAEQTKTPAPSQRQYWQISLPDTQALSAEWASYEDKSIGFSLKYPLAKYALKPDGLNELNKREPGNTLRQSLGKTPPKIIKALRFDDGNYSGETYFTPFALWIYDNSEKLTPDEWWKKYTYFPFLVGSARTETGTITVDNEPTSYSHDYFGSQWYDFYIARKDKMFLFHVETSQNDPQTTFGLQILSTFKFL